jgi:hypothetical protein
MKKFTVVVLYPSRLLDRNREPMAYTAWVTAPNPIAARKAGQVDAWQRQPNDERGKQSEWTPLVVYKGHLHLLASCWESPKL